MRGASRLVPPTDAALAIARPDRKRRREMPVLFVWSRHIFGQPQTLIFINGAGIRDVPTYHLFVYWLAGLGARLHRLYRYRGSVGI